MTRPAGFITLCGILVFPPAAVAGEPFADLHMIGKTHTVVAVNNLDGPGSEVTGLPNTYDMSIFEFNWGARQAVFNGSGITTNANFPLTEGEAVTNNTHVGLESAVGDGWRVGALAELYGLAGDRTVGRVFGEELPWDDFPRESGAIEPPHFQAALYNAFLEGKSGPLSARAVGGTLTSRDLPEFTRKEMNQLKLGSLVWRAPITNASFFEKEDRKLEEGRHPLRGGDVVTDFEFAAGRHLHAEFFAGAAEPTPLSDIEREAFGGRVAADIGNGNIGFTGVRNGGLRAVTGIDEDQDAWAVDGSFRLNGAVTPYGAVAVTDYTRGNTAETHEGTAAVGGAAFRIPGGHDLKAQFQRVGENYDLMAYHKTEHYPSNFQGVNLQGAATLTDALKLKAVWYWLKQIETTATPADTIFGDSFFASTADSNRGTIGVERVGADWRAGTLGLSGYVEHAKFRKNALAAARMIDKDVFNFSVSAALAVTKEWSAEGGFRHFFSVGNWQAMNFRSYQDISEAAIGYKIDPDRHALLIYHYIVFEDHNGAAAGRNDYDAHQVLFEIKTLL